MPIAVRMLTPEDERLFASAAPDLFDDPIDPAATREFLADGRAVISVVRRDIAHGDGTTDRRSEAAGGDLADLAAGLVDDQGKRPRRRWESRRGRFDATIADRYMDYVPTGT